MTYDEDALTKQLGVITLARLRTFVAVGCVRPTEIDGREHFTEADRARIELLCLLQDEFDMSAEGLARRHASDRPPVKPRINSR